MLSPHLDVPHPPSSWLTVSLTAARRACRLRAWRQGPARGVPLRSLERFEFYAASREPDLAVCVATGDDRLYANILFTVGFIAPR
jgi:L-fucose mutarotase/ribose pyranase (RbsD/FucU family)